MRELRLFWQVFWAYLAIMIVVIVGLGLYALHEARRFYIDRQSNELETAAWLCADRFAELVRAERWSEVQTVCEELGQRLSMRITVILPSGKVVGESLEPPERLDNHADRPEIIEAHGGAVGRSFRFSNTRGEELMYVAVPLKREDQVAAVVRTAVPVQSVAQTLRQVQLRIGLAGLAATALVAASSVFVARRIVRPLEIIRDGAERFARGDLDHRLPVYGADEVKMLAESMNRVAQEMHLRMETIISREYEHEAVLSSMDEGVLAIDHAGRILSLNAACGVLLGVEPEKVRGRLIHEVLRTYQLLRFVERTLVSSACVEEDLELRHPENRWIHAHGTLLHDAAGNKIGALIVLHDVTRLRHLENVRRDFVANVSHELRTPITSIKGFVETLLAEELADKETSLRFLRIVLKQADRLDAIINDLLLLSRIERGTEEHSIALDREPILPVLCAAVEMCECKARDKQIHVQVECGEELSASINGPLLEQAVVNLLDNAIKYSSPGSCVRIAASADAEHVVIQVQDEGCGIEAKHLPRLFERFYRVDKARSRELGGTGLGLAIVKHIVAAHRGTVDVESTIGRGSTFSIRLPKSLSPSASPVAAST
jgi:two-component system phosphate regulon sensor histidine kinase PhoR